MGLTVEELTGVLGRIGLGRGDVVMVHSDLRRLGPARDLVKLPHCGADLVIDAFLAAVGPAGLVAFPTFTKCFDEGQPGPSGQVYDPAETPSRVGSISDVFWRRPGAARSSQPTHPVAAMGDRAAAFVAAPEDQSTFDRRGPWGKLVEWDGWVCWLGTDNRTNTFVHAVEDWMDLPYMAVAYCLVKGPDGQAVRTKVTKSPAGARDFYRKGSKSERLLEASGIVRRGQFGNAPIALMRARGLYEVLSEGIKADPCLLLPEASPKDAWTQRAREETIRHIKAKFG